MSWAIYDGKVEVTKENLAHSLWFDNIGLPSYGEGFDRVTRGTIQVIDDKIRIDVYADAGDPEIAIEHINTILSRAGFGDDARLVEVFLQGDCFSKRMM